MAELKHVGRVISTKKKCIVVYRTLPGDAHSCLIVPTENLPDSYHDSLINLVESNAGQSSYEFAEVMARSNFSDGSIMLAALHAQGRLVKLGTSEVEMTPTTSGSIVLSELNQIIAEQRGVAVDDLSLKSNSAEPTASKTVEAPVVEEKIDTTPTISANVTLTPEEQAKQFRSDADRLSKQAAELRRQAEALVPTAKKTKVTDAS
jgi:hypothetical protein